MTTFKSEVRAVCCLSDFRSVEICARNGQVIELKRSPICNAIMQLTIICRKKNATKYLITAREKYTRPEKMRERQFENLELIENNSESIFSGTTFLIRLIWSLRLCVHDMHMTMLCTDSSNNMPDWFPICGIHECMRTRTHTILFLCAPLRRIICGIVLFSSHSRVT